MALSLPNGKTQFIDAAGNPLAAGLVYHYIPGTSTPKTTYQDVDATISNSNPIVLDAGGYAVIFGTGSYRQVVTDSLGNQLWDQVTQVATLSLLGGVAKSGDTMTGTLIVPSLSDTGAQSLTIAPTANPSIPTKASFSVQGSTQSTTQREFQGAFGFTSNKGNGLTGGNQDRVTLYAGMDMVAGSGDAWSFNTVLTMEASATSTANAIGYELDFNNLLDHRGDIVGGGGFAAPVAYGLAVTGAGNKRSTAGILVSGPGTNTIWNRGIAFVNGSVEQATFQDFTSSVISVEIQGAHTYGIDAKAGAFSGAAMRIGNGAFIKARDSGDTADLALLVQSGDNLIIGDAATLGIYTRNLVAPFTDNSVTTGSATNRWSAVWAVNGTIQTSDPREKTDIQTLASVKTGDIIDHIKPISFRWVDGGEGRPGARIHWGFNAEEVGTIPQRAGRDFGGFVKAEDGTMAMRPDQMIPILWEELRRVRKRVAQLEGRA